MNLQSVQSAPIYVLLCHIVGDTQLSARMTFPLTSLNQSTFYHCYLGPTITVTDNDIHALFYTAHLFNCEPKSKE
jgi:hypothetical protein